MNKLQLQHQNNNEEAIKRLVAIGIREVVAREHIEAGGRYFGFYNYYPKGKTAEAVNILNTWRYNRWAIAQPDAKFSTSCPWSPNPRLW